MHPVSTTATNSGAREALLHAARAELIEHGHASIALRAVARRAGVSHAAPKYFFEDRAGMLTAVATEGYQELTAALQEVLAAEPANPLAALGRAYIDFGLGNPALFDLMFRTAELHTDDPQLTRAREGSIAPLVAAVDPLSTSGERVGGHAPAMALVSWAVAHGLVVLARDGALQAAAGKDGAEAARELADLYSERVLEPKRARATDSIPPDTSV